MREMPRSIQEWLFAISMMAMGYSAIIWGVAWVIGYARYMARPAFIGMGLGAILLMIASFAAFFEDVVIHLKLSTVTVIFYCYYILCLLNTFSTDNAIAAFARKLSRHGDHDHVGAALSLLLSPVVFHGTCRLAYRSFHELNEWRARWAKAKKEKAG